MINLRPFLNPYLLKHEMASYNYAAPVYPPPQYAAQTYVSMRPIVTQPAPRPPLPVHPAPPVQCTEYRPKPGGPLPAPIRTSHRQRSERGSSEACDYGPPQSKPREHPGKYDQRRTRPEQSLHPKKAMEYQDQNQEVGEYVRCSKCACCSDHACFSDDDCRSDCGAAISTGPESPRNALDQNYEEMKKPARSQQVHRKGHSSKPRYAQENVESQPDAADRRAKRSSANRTGTERKHTTEKATNSQRARTKCGSSKLDHVETHIESQPDAGDKQAKVSSANPAGTESKHRTKNFTRATHAEPDSKYRPEKPGIQATERTSTNTAGAGRANTTSHSSSTKFSVRPAASHSGPEITINQHKGSPININYDPKHFKVGVSTPDEKSMGHHGKEKPKESSQGSRSKKSVPDGKKKPKESSQGSWSEKPTTEDVPDYYAVLGCSIDDDDGKISRHIKKRKYELQPDRRVKSETMSEQEIAKITEESALVNAAADVLKASADRWAYNEKWHLVYRKDEDGITVPRE